MPPVINTKISWISRIFIWLYGSTEGNRSTIGNSSGPGRAVQVTGASSGDRQEQQQQQQSIEQQQQQQEVQARLSVSARRQEQQQQGLPELLLDSGAAPHFAPTEEGVLESYGGAWSLPQ